MTNKGTMTPANILVRPGEEKYLDRYRKWQGIPSVERTEGGRLFVNFYSGMETETGGNFMVVVTSDDNGQTWNSVEYVVEHDDPEVRVYDPCIWIDPQKRLWLTWNQSRDFFDGRVGVWVSICDNPDENNLTWSAPRRIANGLMMNKPLALSNGEYLFPTAIWACHDATEEYDLDEEKFSNVYSSVNDGKTITYKGGADVPNRSFDEHMVVEKKDGSLWMLVRRFDGIGESHSYDGGKTWTPGKLYMEGTCSRFYIRRLKSGRLLLINHVNVGELNDLSELEEQGNVKAWRGRVNLSAMLSEDDGKTWTSPLLLDERKDAAYPDAVEGEDGYIYIVYDYERFKEKEILMAKITEEDILAGNLVSKNSKLRMIVNKAGV